MLTLTTAKAIADGAIAEARKMKLKPISVVIMDSRASVVALLSEDGVSLMRADIAKGKANAAIGLGMGSRALMQRAEQQAYFVNAVVDLAAGGMVPVAGGVLIRDESNAIIGAVGISGDTSDNDEAAAIAAIKSVGLTADGG